MMLLLMLRRREMSPLAAMIMRERHAYVIVYAPLYAAAKDAERVIKSAITRDIYHCVHVRRRCVMMRLSA